MSTILLTGGTGFIGGHLRSALEDSPVILLGRKKPPLLANERWMHTDLAHPVEPEKLEEGEALCHLAYSMTSGRKNIPYNRHLLEAVNDCRNIRQVILMSSTSVYGENNTPVVDEESSCKPVAEYAKTKLACEVIWREGLRDDCSLTVLRPSSVIGPGGIALLPHIRDALHRPLVGAIKYSMLYHRSVYYVAVGNVVAAVRFCLLRPQASKREVYIVSDYHQPETKNYAAVQDAVREISGRPPFPSTAMPRWILPLLGRITGRPTLGVKQVFSSRKIHEAGFRDATFLRDEVRRAVESLERSA